MHSRIRAQSWADKDVSSRRFNTLKEEIQVQEIEAQEWVENVLGIRFARDLYSSLQSGVRLCQLISKIDPGFKKKFTEDAEPGTFFARDNITVFLHHCVTLGIPKLQLFEPNDLVERKNERRVINTIMDLARAAIKFGFTPPLMVQYELEIEQEERERKAREDAESKKAAEREAMQEEARLRVSQSMSEAERARQEQEAVRLRKLDELEQRRRDQRAATVAQLDELSRKLNQRSPEKRLLTASDRLQAIRLKKVVPGHTDGTGGTVAGEEQKVDTSDSFEMSSVEHTAEASLSTVHGHSSSTTVAAVSSMPQSELSSSAPSASSEASVEGALGNAVSPLIYETVADVAVSSEQSGELSAASALAMSASVVVSDGTSAAPAASDNVGSAAPEEAEHLRVNETATPVDIAVGQGEAKLFELAPAAAASSVSIGDVCATEPPASSASSVVLDGSAVAAEQPPLASVEPLQPERLKEQEAQPLQLTEQPVAPDADGCNASGEGGSHSRPAAQSGEVLQSPGRGGGEDNVDRSDAGSERGGGGSASKRVRYRLPRERDAVPVDRSDNESEDDKDNRLAFLYSPREREKKVYIPYDPDDEDLIDQAVAVRVNELKPDIIIQKIKKGCYQIGDGPYTYLRLVRDVLLARVGGGWMGFKTCVLRKMSMKKRASSKLGLDIEPEPQQ